MKEESTVFCTMVRSERGAGFASLLLKSLRRFGGEYHDAPFWIFETDPAQSNCALAADAHTQLFPLRVPPEMQKVFFGDKVASCANAEEMARAQKVRSLVFVDPVFLFVAPPKLLDLGEEFDAAFRPVHMQNVGIAPELPLNGYWQGILDVAGLSDISSTVHTFVEGKTIRSYFNTHVFSMNPEKGLCEQWLEKLSSLSMDKDFQTQFVSEQREKIFQFQALLAALVVGKILPERLRILPPSYSYPYNLHSSVPEVKKPRTLEELVCFTYEQRSIHPDEVQDVRFGETLEKWLRKELGAAQSD